MHLFLTDRLSCPRCGPEFGLILLALCLLEPLYTGRRAETDAVNLESGWFSGHGPLLDCPPDP